MTTSQISLLALISVGGIGILLIGMSTLMKADRPQESQGLHRYDHGNGH